jgi:type I restriction enzyme S subunit
LPESWVSPAIGEVCAITSGYGFPKTLQGKPTGDLPFFKVGDISKSWHRGEIYLAKAEHYLSEAEARSIRAKPLPKNTTAFAKIGAAIARNRRAVLAQPSLIDNNCMALSANPDHVAPRYLFYYTCTLRFGDLSRASIVPSLRKSDVSGITLPLPPRAEQARIVAKIEELLSNLDVGVAALERAKAKAKRYRAAVLQAAVAGRLTEPWRAANPPQEPASKLLGRVLQERRKKWEQQQLAACQAEGKKPRNNGQAQYREPKQPDRATLPALPEGWCWATVDQLGAIGEQPVLTGPFGSTLGRKDFIPSGAPVLTIGCLTPNGLSFDNALYVSEQKARDLGRYRVETGDLLFSRSASVGRVACVDAEFAGSLINYHLMRLRLAQEVIDPVYFATYVRGSPIVRAYLRQVNHGATRDGINTGQLLGMPVALPPVDEQTEIHAEVESRSAMIRSAESLLATCFKRSACLRQSILKRAFEGKLVPQDPNDEPAEALLVRIRSEHGANGQQRKPKKRAKKATVKVTGSKS